MEDIRFRGKSIARQREGEWIYGYLVPHSLFEDPDFTADYWIATGHEDEAFPVDTKTVGQYTGEKDAEGKEVYDKDVVEFDRNEWRGDDNIHLVSWNDEDVGWSFGGGTGKSDMRFRKVIGNIIDNPELLN